MDQISYSLPYCVTGRCPTTKMQLFFMTSSELQATWGMSALWMGELAVLWLVSNCEGSSRKKKAEKRLNMRFSIPRDCSWPIVHGFDAFCTMQI